MVTREELPALTGLRGIAALLVVISHYAFWCAAYPRASVPATYTAIFDHVANCGMTLFFTLSGFVIAYNYLDLSWRDAPFATLYRFLVLRFSRLYPVLLLFVGFIALNYPLGSRPNLVTALHVASVQSWLPFVYEGSLFNNGPFNVAWSISTEAMLYILFATAMIVVGRFSGRARRIAIGLCLLLVLAVAGLAFDSDRIGAGLAAMPAAIEPVSADQARAWFLFMSPWFRIIDFTWGVLAALTVTRGLHRKYVRLVAPQASVAAFAVVCLQLLVVERGGHWLSPHLQLATGLLFAVIIAGANADTRMNRILSSPALVLTGTVSYSLYLFHFLAANAFGPEHIEDFSAPGVVIMLFRMAAMIPFSVVIAATLYVVVEKPAKLWLRSLLLSRPHQTTADVLSGTSPMVSPPSISPRPAPFADK